MGVRVIRPAAPVASVAALAPYATADMSAPDWVVPISLAQNESLRPPSPLAMAAAAEAAGSAQLYPDAAWGDLRRALAAHHGIPAEGILCGNGSLDLIAALARVFAGPGRAVLAPAHAYPFFRSAALMAGARFDTAPERDATVSVEALLAAQTPETSLVFVANPGNPTGTRLPVDSLRSLRAGLRPDVLLVIDEAYGEFADHLGERCFDMVARGDTVVLRTFSKAYGLAGLRIGWGAFPPPIAGEMRKVLNPNNVSCIGLAAAVAALADQAYLAETCRLTAERQERAAARVSAAGIRTAPCATNFLLLDFGDADRALGAEAWLRARGIFLRRQAGAGLPQMLRMTIGDAAAMEAALSALEEWQRKGPG
ncbi:MAG: histidinol-phosphate transaminase [Pseudomonadota bacterium]